MAFDLRAILRLDDKFSSPMRRVERQVAKSQRVLDRLNTATNKTGNAAQKAGRQYSSFGKNVGSLNRGLGGLTTTLFGVAGAYAAINTSKKIFDTTVLEAAKFEQSNVVIGAMFDDKALAAQYTAMVDRISVDSPILDSQGMYANSKSFLQTTKNMKQLEKMWGLAERMAAIDPVQGLEGSVFALRELFSGDAISMIERFEMPREIMNEIKKLPIEQQLTRLDQYFNKIGMTTKLIDEMGGTTLGKWAQVKEQMAIIFRDIGQPALAPISKWLTEIITKFDTARKLDGKIVFNPDTGLKEIFKSDFTKFKEVGGKIIKNIISGLTEGSMAIYDWFTQLINSAEWKKQSTVFAKVSFVMDDIFANFIAWLENGGDAKIEKLAKSLFEALSGSIRAVVKVLMPVALEVGEAIGDGIMDGIKTSLKGVFSLKNLSGKEMINDLFGNDEKILSHFNGGKEKKAKKKKSITDLPSGVKGYFPKKNGGLDYVPYDGATYSMHRGEAILTRGEARDYREGKGNSGGNNYQFNVALGSGSTREQARELFEYFVKEVEASGEAGA